MTHVEANKWIDSLGGPLVIVPCDRKHLWGGIIRPKVPISDYDKACAIDDYIDVIMSDAGPVLVLGGEPFSTTWRPSLHGILLICWIFADSHEEVENTIASAEFGSEVADSGLVFTASGPCRIFDATEPGDDIREASTVLPMEPGRYAIFTGFHSPNSRTRLLVHALRKIT